MRRFRLPPPVASPGGTDTLALYEAYRSYIRHEDGLINFRTTWFLGIQGVLFTAFGGGLSWGSVVWKW